MFTKLKSILLELRKADAVGDINERKPYIMMSCKMTWGTFEHLPDIDSQITFWGAKLGNTVIGLAGSKYNLLGEQADGHAHSQSLTSAIVHWIYNNLQEPFPLVQPSENRSALNGGQGGEELSTYDIANATMLASTQIRGPENRYDFLAKVLHYSEWPEGFGPSHLPQNLRDSSIQRVILGSPLYVALDE